MISRLGNEKEETSELANINETIKPDYGVTLKNQQGAINKGQDYLAKEFKNKKRMNMSMYKTNYGSSFNVNYRNASQSFIHENNKNINTSIEKDQINKIADQSIAKILEENLRFKKTSDNGRNKSIDRNDKIIGE